LLLLNTLGILPIDAWRLFWPLILIVMGLWFIFGRRFFRQELELQRVSVPLEGAPAAEIEMKHGAGQINLTALDQSGMLMEGDFYGGLKYSLDRQADRVRLRMEPEIDVVLPAMPTHRGLDWNLGLARDLPLKIRLEGGANQSDLDLTNLLVRELVVHTGASATTVRLPTNAGHTRVEIQAGAASVKLYLPEGVEGRIHAGGGLSGLKIDSNRFLGSGQNYETPGFQAATNRVEIEAETGVGSVEVL